MLRDWSRLAVHRDDADDTSAFEDRQPIASVEPRETVAGEQRPVDLLLAILPSAPLRDGRQKHVNPLLLQLLADNLFMARSRPDREPWKRFNLGIRRNCHRGVASGWDICIRGRGWR